MPVKRITVDVVVRVEEVKTVTYGDAPVNEIVIDYHKTFLTGTGQGQADRVYADERQYTASTAVDHDVNTYTDTFGTASQAVAKVKLVAVHTKNTTSGQQWQIGGDANSVPLFGAAADYLKLGPEGLLLWVDPIDGIASTASTGDIIQVAPPAAAAVAEVVVAGSSS